MSACLIAAAFSGVQSSSCPKSNPALILSFCLFLLVALLLFATAHLLRENNFEEEEEDPLADALDENEVDATVVGKSNVRSIYYNLSILYSL